MARSAPGTNRGEPGPGLRLRGLVSTLVAWTLALLILGAGLAGSAAGVAEADSEEDSAVVGEVRMKIDGADGLDPDTLAVLGIEPGRPLDRRRLREGVLALYAGGEIDSVRIDTTPGATGLLVEVLLRHRSRLTDVSIEGVSGRLRRNVLSWLDLPKGGGVSTSRIETGARRVLRQLREAGYTEVRVEPYLDYDRAANTVAVSLLIDLGPPQLLRSVQVTGLRDGEPPLEDLQRLRLGERLGERQVERVRADIERDLRERGYWEAVVTGVERRPQPDGVALVVRVDPGALYRFRVSGPGHAAELLEKVLPDPAEEDIHPAQTDALSERLREGLQRDGWLLARVSAELELEQPELEAPGPGTRTLLIHLSPGPRLRVGLVELEGATSVPIEDLLGVLAVHAGRTTGWRGQDVTQATLEADRLQLIDLYKRRGFAEVIVERAQIEPLAAGEARVWFQIDEGRRWLLTELRQEGFPVEAAALLEDRRSILVPGGPWDPRQVEPERRRLELVLADAGYADGRVAAEVDVSQPGAARVIMRAEPGQQVRIGEVVIAGLESVHRGVVRRAIERFGVGTGEVYALDRLLAAQRELYSLGLFRRVELVPIPGQEHRPDRGLVVRCEEGAHRSYLIGAGWDTDERVRVTLGWSHLNLLGGGHAFSMESRLSSREQRYQLSLREHRLRGIDEPAALVAYRTEEELSTYSQLRRGLWLEVGDRRRTPFRRWLRYEYQIVRPNAPPDILSTLERQDREIQMASLTPNLEWDTRDDPLSPSSGLLATLSTEYAFPAFKANARFLKARGSLSMYGKLGRGTGACGLRLGATHPIGAGGDGPENLEIPLNVRFFSGGIASHRAFATDRLGVPGQTLDEDGNAIGGNALLLLNAEYQRPVRGALSGVVFLDVGNVWAEPSTVSLSDLRWGGGLGLRYETPAGPLRLEYGFKLDRNPGESTGELFFSFGVPF